MRWPWRRRNGKGHEAERHLDQLRRQEPKVDRLSTELTKAREANHFSQLVAAALRGEGRRAAPDR